MFFVLGFWFFFLCGVLLVVFVVVFCLGFILVCFSLVWFWVFLFVWLGGGLLFGLVWFFSFLACFSWECRLKADYSLGKFAEHS